VKDAEGKALGINVSELACYINFLGEEEEHQVAHAMKLTAAVAAAVAAAVPQNERIYEVSRRFEKQRQERLRAAAAGDGCDSSSSSVASSSSASY
jgi:hypothetical protein